MATAVDDASDEEVTVTGCQRQKELLPQTAVLGRSVFESSAQSKAFRLECVAPRPGSRATFTPRDGARLKDVPGDGKCAYHAVCRAYQACVGVARSKVIETLKQMVIIGGLQHVFEGSGFDDIQEAVDCCRRGNAEETAPATAAALGPLELNTELSKEHLERARALRLTELRTRSTDHHPDVPEPRTYNGLIERVCERVEQDWLDVTWFAILANSLRVNIALWEPSGQGEKLQLYSAGGMAGLFLYSKRFRHDEEGDLWLHLLYHTDDAPFASRDVSAGQITHNHFGWLQLGENAQRRFLTQVISAPAGENLVEPGMSGVAHSGADKTPSQPEKKPPDVAKRTTSQLSKGKGKSSVRASAASSEMKEGSRRKPGGKDKAKQEQVGAGISRVANNGESKSPRPPVPMSPEAKKRGKTQPSRGKGKSSVRCSSGRSGIRVKSSRVRVRHKGTRRRRLEEGTSDEWPADRENKDVEDQPAFAAISDDSKVVADAKKISEPAYREAFIRCRVRKSLGDEVRRSCVSVVLCEMVARDGHKSIGIQISSVFPVSAVDQYGGSSIVRMGEGMCAVYFPCTRA